jgi:hypothetical protein
MNEIPARGAMHIVFAVNDELFENQTVIIT